MRHWHRKIRPVVTGPGKLGCDNFLKKQACFKRWVYQDSKVGKFGCKGRKQQI